MREEFIFGGCGRRKVGSSIVDLSGCVARIARRIIGWQIDKGGGVGAVGGAVVGVWLVCNVTYCKMVLVLFYPLPPPLFDTSINCCLSVIFISHVFSNHCVNSNLIFFHPINDNDNEIILFGHREKTVKC